MFQGGTLWRQMRSFRELESLLRLLELIQKFDGAYMIRCGLLCTELGKRRVLVLAMSLDVKQSGCRLVRKYHRFYAVDTAPNSYLDKAKKKILLFKRDSWWEYYDRELETWVMRSNKLEQVSVIFDDATPRACPNCQNIHNVVTNKRLHQT